MKILKMLAEILAESNLIIETALERLEVLVKVRGFWRGFW